MQKANKQFRQARYVVRLARMLSARFALISPTAHCLQTRYLDRALQVSLTSLRTAALLPIWSTCVLTAQQVRQMQPIPVASTPILRLVATMSFCLLLLPRLCNLFLLPLRLRRVHHQPPPALRLRRQTRRTGKDFLAVKLPES